VIRIAAFGDIHVGLDSIGRVKPHLADVGEHADVLLIAGDLTKRGYPDEARVFVDELADVAIPKVAVLGNHDWEVDREDEVVKILEDGGVQVLECDSTLVEVRGTRLGIAGAKGFGGGFAGACAHAFGEPEMKAFIRHTEGIARQLEQALTHLDAEVKVGLLHYAPVEDTLQGERLEIFPFLGSYLLGEAIDRGGASLALHGHAHAGTEHGTTPGGVPVRNVAIPVIARPYKVYCLNTGDGPDCSDV
jgi:Icc-related predicted phosphoesterase